jgi:hypothetical protein
MHIQLYIYGAAFFIHRSSLLASFRKSVVLDHKLSRSESDILATFFVFFYIQMHRHVARGFFTFLPAHQGRDVYDIEEILDGDYFVIDGEITAQLML